MMIITINPSALKNHKQMTLLRALLEGNKDYSLWLARQTFNVKNQTIQLTHTIFSVNCSDSPLIYRIITHKPIAEGAQGSAVHAVDCAFSFIDNNTIDYYSENMVVKIQTKPLTKENTNLLIKGSLREYHFSRLTNHLHVEKPSIVADENILKSLIFMNRIASMDLFTFVEHFFSTKIASTFLFMITSSLLAAYQEQVLELGIRLHADIKPENIMIDLGLNEKEINCLVHSDFSPNQLIIKLIDYAFCLHPNETIEKGRGTRDYSAPEMLTIKTPTSFNNEKPDIYSLGICLNFLWFRQRNLLAKTDTQYSTKTNKLYKTFYEGESSGFSEQILASIQNIIINMTHHDPLKRWSLSQSIVAINLIAKTNVDWYRSPKTQIRDTPFQFFQKSERAFNSQNVAALAETAALGPVFH